MNRSLTVAVPSSAQIVKAILGIGIAVLIVFVGLRLGGSLLGPAGAQALSTGSGLQEIHTTQGVYVGQLVKEDDSYLSLRTPAVVREAQDADGGSGSGRILVILLASEPYYIAGDVVLPRDQVILVGNVTPGSPLDTAYRQATGELPPPSSTPSSAP